MQTQAYDIFWQRIHCSAKKNKFPLRIIFELTYRCNFSCKHCYVPQNYRKLSELKTREIFVIIDELKKIGCLYLGFTGGEPFMRKDIMRILWYAKKNGFEIIIYTNGSLINKKIAAELSELRPNKVDITIPAMSKSVFERISGRAGSWENVFKAIEWLNKGNVNLGFKSCVLKENQSEIKNIQDFAKSLGALHRLDEMLSARLDGSKQPYKYRAKTDLLTLNDKLESNRCNLMTTKNEIKSTSVTNIFKCGVGVSQAAITPQGKLKPCLMINQPSYKISNMSLKICWENIKNTIDKIKPDKNYKCNSCKLISFCKWCPAKSWLEYGSFTRCDPESYLWAKREQLRY